RRALPWGHCAALWVVHPRLEPPRECTPLADEAATIRSPRSPCSPATVSPVSLSILLSLRTAAGPRSLRQWRKRVGIEPTAAGVSQQPDGFEGRASHQTRIASGDG